MLEERASFSDPESVHLMWISSIKHIKPRCGVHEACSQRRNNLSEKGGLKESKLATT